jgi:23S rRNA (adenine2503-C2)-methyltransferase
MLNLYTLSFNDLADLLQQWGQPGYRAEQVWGWLYDRFETDFDNMLNLPADLRDRLKAETTIGSLTTVTEQNSTDGTRKRLYRLPDGQMIEAVLMTYDDQRRTACISTQAGCAMGCVFCATGQMGFARHLTASEIVEQALIFAAELHAEGDRLSNIVLMGMGEPFHNYDESLRAMHRLMNDLGIGARHITVSTVGIAPKIRQFADEGLQINLAISLHAATDAERSDLLPVNRRWDLHELMSACRYYVGKTGRRLTFEWALIHGETDTEEQAHALGKLLQGMLCHVNAIPLNPTDGYSGGPSNVAAADRFQQILESYGVGMTVRVRRGINIDAGCGQLSAKVNAPVTIAVEDVE